MYGYSNMGTCIYNSKERDSLPEVFRIVLMGMIVFWHLVLYGRPSYSTSPLLLSLTTLTHVAVPCFVIMSGWYGIRPSIRGFVRLVVMVVFYSLLGLLFRAWLYKECITAYSVLSALSPLFHGRWWFIEVYLALYLTVPLLESFVSQSNTRRVWIMAGFLWFVSFWLGQPSSWVGRLPLFYMLYLMGRTFNSRFSGGGKHPFMAFCACCAVSIVACQICSILGGKWLVVYRIVFWNYSGPWLIISSMFLSLTFLDSGNNAGRFRSRLVNSMAAAVFPCYLIHEKNFISTITYDWFGSVCHGEAAIIGWGCVATFVILISCCCIDFVCRPIYSIVARSIAMRLSDVAAKV